MFVSFFGASRKPDTLSIRDWQRFIAERKAGRVHPRNTRHKGAVGEEIIRGDLAFLSAVLNFAAIAGDGKGGTLIERNSLKGLPYPKNDSPKRAVLSAEQYVAVRTASTAIGAPAELFVVLAHETGHRGASIRCLRWSDVDFAAKRIHWLGSNDKMGNDHTTPITDEALAALSRYRAATFLIGDLGDALIFPSRSDSTQPMKANVPKWWWIRIAKIAGLPEGDRYGWHSLRRKFASELRNTNLRDLCDLGGWKKPETVLTCYVRSDEGAQREALNTRERILRAVS